MTYGNNLCSILSICSEPPLKGDISWVTELERKVTSLIERGVAAFQADLTTTLGIVAAETVLRLKKEIPALRLICRQTAGADAQTGEWRERRNRVAKQADELIWETSRDGISAGELCRLHMIAEASHLILLYSDERAGEILQCGMGQGREIIKIDIYKENDSSYLFNTFTV